jgi:hypothetical protein
MKHPLYTVELLEQVLGISDLIRVVSSQIHECFDGSGYPAGRSGQGIHPFARILGVADAYISLTSEMRGRPAVIPCDAMVCLLYQGRQGTFDREAVRALVRTLSMFPIGSHVRLKDGSEAKVLRANRTQYTRPMVQRLFDEKGIRIDSAHETSVIDLAESEIDVQEPLPTPHHREMRLEPAERMHSMVWDRPNS